MKHLSQYSQLLLIGQAILLLFLSPAYADDALQAAHHGRDNTCTLCHGNDTEIIPENSERCSGCHQRVAAGARLKKLQNDSTPSAKKNIKTDPLLGLSRPMYSAVTVLGVQPTAMVLIPAGEFIMGSNTRLEDEGPEHRVTLASFNIDKHEVTNAQYADFMRDSSHRSPSHFRNRTFPEGKADHPVTFVSWFDATAYCGWTGKRLPTEQEWEKAARGTDGRIFPWGDQFELAAANTPVRWARLKQDGDTTPVSGFPLGRSPYGLDDMSGNVWEWVASWYGPHPGNVRQSENFGEINKVLKGGSWWDCSFYKCGISAPAFNRSFFNPRVRNSSFGFRCVGDV